MGNNIDDDWLGQLMAETNNKATQGSRPTQPKPLPTAPPTAPVVPAYNPSELDRFLELYFMIDNQVRQCYYAWKNGDRDVYWLRPNEFDHHKAFAFDVKCSDRERLFIQVKGGNDVQPLGNLNSKPRL
jgi:hypothetical protein